jgi:hypothetical protein
MAAVVEAQVVEMRRERPGWGPRTIRTRLGREGVALLPGACPVCGTLGVGLPVTSAAHERPSGFAEGGL